MVFHCLKYNDVQWSTIFIHILLKYGTGMSIVILGQRRVLLISRFSKFMYFPWDLEFHVPYTPVALPKVFCFGEWSNPQHRISTDFDDFDAPHRNIHFPNMAGRADGFQDIFQTSCFCYIGNSFGGCDQALEVVRDFFWKGMNPSVVTSDMEQKLKIQDFLGVSKISWQIAVDAILVVVKQRSVRSLPRTFWKWSNLTNGDSMKHQQM